MAPTSAGRRRNATRKRHRSDAECRRPDAGRARGGIEPGCARRAVRETDREFTESAMEQPSSECWLMRSPARRRCRSVGRQARSSLPHHTARAQLSCWQGTATSSAGRAAPRCFGTADSVRCNRQLSGVSLRPPLRCRRPLGEARLVRGPSRRWVICRITDWRSAARPPVRAAGGFAMPDTPGQQTPLPRSRPLAWRGSVVARAWHGRGAASVARQTSAETGRGVLRRHWRVFRLHLEAS